MTACNGQNPRSTTPATDPLVAPADEPSGSLVEEFGGIVDDLRQLYTDVGLRPYRVFLVRVRWGGGEIGRGEATVVSEAELLPTPEVDFTPLRTEIKSGGKVERGGFTLREISPRYTEDEILDLFHVERGFQVFVEVRHDSRDGQQPKRRRFTVKDVPWRKAKDFQWVARLQVEEQARNRDGSLPGPKRHDDRRSV